MNFFFIVIFLLVLQFNSAQGLGACPKFRIVDDANIGLAVIPDNVDINTGQIILAGMKGAKFLLENFKATFPSCFTDVPLPLIQSTTTTNSASINHT
jgi:hypothetical protein